MFRLVIFSLVLLLGACGKGTPVDDQSYPWQIKITQQGNSQVFDIELNAMPLGLAASKIAKSYQLALFEDRDGNLSLEAYFGEVTRGGLTGRVILRLETSVSQLQSIKTRSLKQERQDSGGVKYTLAFDDQKQAQQFIVFGLTYIPYVHLDREMIEKRFGLADRVVSSSDGLTHYLYIKKGLDIIQDPDGKEILQYVTPSGMDVLLQPLQQQAQPKK